MGLRKKIIDEIKRFRSGGSLSKEWDTKRVRFTGWTTNPGGSDTNGDACDLDEVERREPFESREATTLAERMSEFRRSLSQMEEKVFGLHMVSGLDRHVVASILGITHQRVASLVGGIRKKALKKTIEKPTFKR